MTRCPPRRSPRCPTRRLYPPVAVALALLALPVAAGAQAFASADPGPAVQEDRTAAETLDVTFTRDIAPILQRSCQSCHRPAGVAPMSLTTYDEVRPWAPIILDRTHRGERMGQMPPYYVERGIGIQQYQDDERLSEAELAAIAAWVEAGAPEGDPADLPPPREWADVGAWALGEPDLVVRTEDFFMEAGAPDWWGDMPRVPTGLEEDRYVSAVEIREVNDVADRGAAVGGSWIVHHMIWSTRTETDDGEAARTGWPVHELGRNPDIFDPRAGRLLRAGSEVVSNSVHLNSSGQDTRAHLEIGFHFHPLDYEPEYESGGARLGDGMNIDIRAMEDGQTLHAFWALTDHVKLTSFEPHLHAPGYRMCLEAIWGNLIETLACAGYDHNWVKQYTFEDDYAPLLPKGTILHIVAEMDNTPENRNIPDPRNWQGSGNRSVTNMFIDLGNRVRLTDEQFTREMVDRRERLGVTENDHIVGCPLCMADIPVVIDDDEEEEATADAEDAGP